MKINYYKKLIEDIEGKLSLSDKFDDATKNKKLGRSNINYPESWKKINFKTYPRFDRISLNGKVSVDKNLGILIRERKSIRDFSNHPISKDELSYLLFSSCGLIEVGNSLDNSRRPYSSAGARYPLEVYPLIFNCKDIKKGLYHYNVKEHSLELLLQEDLTNWFFKVIGKEQWLMQSAVVFIITGVLDRTRIKYGDRGYRYILIEAGHLGQNVSLLATELGLGSCALGGFIDAEVDRLLDIDFTKETTLYLIAIGKK